MLREILQNISEAKEIKAVALVKDNVSYEDVLDWLDEHGGYETIDQYAKGELGIDSEWSSANGSVYYLTPKQFKEFENKIKDIAELVELDGAIDFKSIKSKKDFEKLSDKGKLAYVYYWATGKTDIQPSNIKDLVADTTSKKVVFTSNSASIDIGKDSISGMEELPFGLKISDMKKIIKGIKNK